MEATRYQIAGCVHSKNREPCGETVEVIHATVTVDKAQPFGAAPYLLPACRKHADEMAERSIIAIQMTIELERAPRTPETIAARALQRAAAHLSETLDSASTRTGGQLARTKRAVRVVEAGGEATATLALLDSAEAVRLIAEDLADAAPPAASAVG